MYKSKIDIGDTLGHFHIKDRTFRYSNFIPRLFNLCKSYGFEPGKIMPSRAFCSDENQGYAIILITKHFGMFPFNHGRVGGIVATDRHGPHAHHGRDMVIIQASHVGYDPELNKFGTYRRICTEDHEISSSCGKIDHILSWYANEYKFAKSNIFIEETNDEHHIIIDNLLLDNKREEGLFLNLEKMVESDGKEIFPIKSFSTSKCYKLARDNTKYFKGLSKKIAIGKELGPDYFYFKRNISEDTEGRDHIEKNLISVMPWIITSEAPLLTAAKISTQIEFDRTFRTIVKEKAYHGKRVLFISGLNIDISPSIGQLYPVTQFVPWAAFVQTGDGKQFTLEQDELYQALEDQSSDNPDQINMEESIQQMMNMKEVKIV